jgi:hypothetical protein
VIPLATIDVRFVDSMDPLGRVCSNITARHNIGLYARAVMRETEWLGLLGHRSTSII